jgi:predicted dehydrogenase
VIGIGILGAGYWGPKHVRNFGALPGVRVTMVADLDRDRLGAVAAQQPGLATTTDHRALLADPATAGVVVATPVSTHARLAREALLAGKHVLVEKPLAASSRECAELGELAARLGRVLMVGHTFVYNPAVGVLRELVAAGELGELYYAHSQRLNLGLFQRDINVLWDLAPHDLSILMHVLGAEPTAVAARGRAHLRRGVEDVAHMELVFPRGVGATVHVSWLDPTKTRRLTLVGSRKMAVYDDLEPVAKVRVYDKGVDLAPAGAAGEPRPAYRDGATAAPPIPWTEPLRLECQHFVDCIRTGAAPLTGPAQGTRVVRALEAASASLAAGGAPVPVPPFAEPPGPPAAAVAAAPGLLAPGGPAPANGHRN